ncbi:MAG TPA: IPT/TIG domain-containing protein [Terriglobales bacterium]|nr:IPT/TIG domain-containing protein [Terriglobales bacterium]
MGISERLLGKRSLDGKPHISAVSPQFALPGGEMRISGTGLLAHEMRRPRVLFGEEPAAVVISAEDFVVARVPDDGNSGPVSVVPDDVSSNALEVKIAGLIAENLHPVTNPAVDHEGNLFVTFSGSRGQKVPVSIYKIDSNYEVKPFLAELMNAHGIAFDRDGQMYVSSRQNGTVYRVAPNGTMSAYAEGMGIASGIAFDREQNLYVGDRSGTIFKIGRDRQTFVFATMEPSVSAYHLAFGPDQSLYVSGPTTTSYDAIYRVDPQGNSSVFFRGLGRPQGMAFDVNGNMYIAASYAGKRGIVRITPDKKAALCVSGQNLVGLCFIPGKSAVLATTSAVFHLSWNIQGLPLLP